MIEKEMQIGRIDLGPTQPRHPTQTEQRMMDAGLRHSMTNKTNKEPTPPIFARDLPEALRVQWLETRAALFQIGELTGNEADLWAWRIVHRGQ